MSISLYSSDDWKSRSSPTGSGEPPSPWVSVSRKVGLDSPRVSGIGRKSWCWEWWRMRETREGNAWVEPWMDGKETVLRESHTAQRTRDCTARDSMLYVCIDYILRDCIRMVANYILAVWRGGPRIKACCRLSTTENWMVAATKVSLLFVEMSIEL